jgi:hypothetical protein
MKNLARTLLLMCAAATAGCAVARDGLAPQPRAGDGSAGRQLRCGTPTLKGSCRPRISHRACVDAKARQHVD